MRYIFIIVLLVITVSVNAQSKTTEALHKKYNGKSLFFYNNTLRMVNQKDDKDFDELVKDIEKMKFLMIKKEDFGNGDYKKLVSAYKSEAFEEMMTSRHEGRNFDVYMREGKSKGMIVTVSDTDNLYVLDIVGSIPLNKVTSFFNTLDESSEIAKQIQNFTSHKH